MTTGQRIRKLRRSLDLTQQEFADRLGVSRGNIGAYETDKSNVGPAAFSLICREFGVSEAWLRDGTGEMYESKGPDTLGDYLKERGVTELEEEIIRAWMELPPKERRELLTHFQRRLTNRGAISSTAAEVSGPETPEERHERHKREARAEADALYEEILQEKTAADGLSVSDTGTGGFGAGA